MSRGQWSQPLQGHTPGPCWSLRWVAAVAPVGGPFSWFVTKGRDVGSEGGGQAQPACTSNQFIYLNNKHPAFRGARPRAVPEWDETLCLHRSPPTLPWGFNSPASHSRKWQASFRASQAVQECGWRQSRLLQWPEANSLLQGLLSLLSFKSLFILPAVFIHLDGDEEKILKILKKKMLRFLPQKRKQCWINRMSLKRQTGLSLKEPDGLPKRLLKAAWWGQGNGWAWGVCGLDWSVIAVRILNPAAQPVKM